MRMDVRLNPLLWPSHLLMLLEVSFQVSSPESVRSHPCPALNTPSTLPHLIGLVFWKWPCFFLVRPWTSSDCLLPDSLSSPPTQVLDGRRPTGGRLEVMVRIREPLTSQQLETTTERWLVIDPVPAAMPTVRLLPVSYPGGGFAQGGQDSKDLVLSSEAGCWAQREDPSCACPCEGAKEQVGGPARPCGRETPLFPSQPLFDNFPSGTNCSMSLPCSETLLGSSGASLNSSA